MYRRCQTKRVPHRLDQYRERRAWVSRFVALLESVLDYNTANNAIAGPESAKVYSPASGQRCPATEYPNTKRCAPCYEQERDCVCQLHHISVRSLQTYHTPDVCGLQQIDFR
jgi:hypothetical protein